MHYKIVWVYDQYGNGLLDKLEKRVNELINEGYEPLGAPLIESFSNTLKSPESLIQAMIKKEQAGGVV
jgi:hypothetical protein